MLPTERRSSTPMASYRVLCTLANASSSINGVAFTATRRGMLSESSRSSRRRHSPRSAATSFSRRTTLNRAKC
jgi:hypothetical protein